MPLRKIEPGQEYRLDLITDGVILPKSTFFIGPLALRVAGHNPMHARRADDWSHANVALISPKASDPATTSEGMWYPVGSVEAGNKLRIGRVSLHDALKSPHHRHDLDEIGYLKELIHDYVDTNHVTIVAPEQRDALFVTLMDVSQIGGGNVIVAE